MENTFYMDDKDWKKIHNYSQAAYDTEKSEIGGMLVAIEDEAGDWHLKDPVILKQAISAGNCVLDKEALAPYYTKAGAKYKDKNFRFVWWHSHHTMSAFWSGTDLNAIQEYSDGDFSFALVVNLKGEYKLRVSVWKPFVCHEDVELEIITDEHKVPKSILKEVGKLCTKQAITSYSPKSYKTTYTKNYPLNAKPSVEDRQTSVFIQPTEYNYACDSIDKINKSYSDGTLSYNDWTKAVSELNNELATKYAGEYLIGLLSKKALDEDIMFAPPADYVYRSNSNAYDIYADYRSNEVAWGGIY
jgi:proteasome lid subunit RPN8/RPN11